MGGGTFVNKWLQKIKDLFEPTSDDSKKRPSKFSYLLIIGLIGLFILLVSNIFSSSKQEETIPDTPINTNDVDTQQTTSKDNRDHHDKEELEKNYQKQLEEMIENIQGVTNVEVMINLDSTHVQVYEKNIITGNQTTDETDTNGGKRKVQDETEETEVVLVRQGDEEVPLLVQTKKPDVRGVFIVANGVEDATTKMWVVESIAKVLDVPPHRISVMPK